jgi:3-phenylpropionate/trans-cinnamate dioxygenase ferredoxin reductase subunit
MYRPDSGDADKKASEVPMPAAFPGFPMDVPVVAVRSVGPDTVAIELDTPDGFDAYPGQFVKLSLDVGGEEKARFYTISSPDVAESFEVTVGIDPEGELAPRLAEVEAGAEIGVEGPFGEAYYDGEGRAVVLAGGPGVGPAVGIAERALSAGEDAAVVYADDEPVHESRLHALDAARIDVTTLGADADLTEPVAAACADGGTVFVYGFEPFVERARAALDAAGVPEDAVRVESFG